jgi:hypothetical protein
MQHSSLWLAVISDPRVADASLPEASSTNPHPSLFANSDFKLNAPMATHRPVDQVSFSWQFLCGLSSRVRVSRAPSLPALAQRVYKFPSG